MTRMILRHPARNRLPRDFILGPLTPRRRNRMKRTEGSKP